MPASLLDRPFGIYEKALPDGPWPRMLADARQAGFDYLEMSIDESDQRLARLDWSRQPRRDLVRACEEQDISIFSICLSAHRRFGLGSAHAEVRNRAAEILDATVGLASDLGIRVVQIAGYYAYYEDRDRAARSRYVEGLRRGLALAERRGVMLAIENIDTADMASVTDCIALRDEIASPWLQIYPDVGNLAVHKLDVAAELTLLRGAAVGLHLKDARPGQPRRVQFGDGDVPFDLVFASLAEECYDGPLTLEMWNDESPTAVRAAADALTWIKERMREAAAAGGAAGPPRFAPSVGTCTLSTPLEAPSTR